MTTIYETEKPVFNNNAKYLYVVNSISNVPEGFQSVTKSDYRIYGYIRRGYNVVITYKDLMYLDIRSLKHLKDYTLVIDGVFNLFDTIKLYKDDINSNLLETNMVKVDNNKMTWLDEDYVNGVYKDVMRACHYGEVTVITNELLTYTFTGNLFNYFKDVNIYTVYFKGQLLKYLFDKCNVEYNIISDKYDKPNVKIIDNVKLDSLGKSYKSFNNNWVNAHLGKVVANPLVNIIKKLKKEGKSVVWTTFDSNYTKVSSKGCKTLFKSMNDTTKINVDVGFFMANPFIDKYVMQYFNNSIDVDEYELPTLLRFLYTTNVKEVYIPSSRMKKLLNDFLI